MAGRPRRTPGTVTKMDETSPERVTRQPRANEQLLYFTSPSLDADDRRLVFLSDRTGDPNIFSLDLDSGDETQLTSNHEGYLKSYVYFDGTPYRGLGKASIALHPSSGTVYYIQGREIRKVGPDGQSAVLARYPGDQMTAFTHVSADGHRLCVPTVDARALEAPLRSDGKPDIDIDARIRAEGLSSYLRVYDTESGEEILTEPVGRSWITHVQFSPVRNDWILYNHEWPSSDWGIRRMWLFDGERHTPLRREGGGRARDDFVCHEMWERDGGAIIYHGSFGWETPFVGRVTPDGEEVAEIALPNDSDRYGHFTVGAPGVLVSDGYYEAPGDLQNYGGDWISRLTVDWQAGTVDWQPLCRNRSSWASQDAHPHPVVDHAMRHVYFTSDKDGKRAVYRVPLDPEEP